MTKPILFTIIGALTGIIVSQVAEHSGAKGTEYLLLAFVLFVISFTLLWEKVSKAILIKSLGMLAAILVGSIIYYFSQGYHQSYKTQLAPVFVIALIQVISISTTFFQSWKGSKPYYHYDDLFENAWNNHFYYIFSGLLMGAFLLILGLGGLLFDTLGFKASQLIWNDNITPVIMCALLGTGMGISREYEQLIFKFRSIFFALFKVLAYLTAAIVILFALVLPFYLDNLLANKHTSQILLSIVAISILLLNALKDTKFSLFPVFTQRIFTLQIIILPVFSALSLYAVSLRIEQYGLMPFRIIAFWAGLLIGAHALGYLIQLVINKGEWTKGFARVNPPLAFIWVISILLLMSPALDPIKLSVNNQVARLKSEQISADTFDFYALKNRLGNAGEKAIETISQWEDHPEIAKIKEQIKNPRINPIEKKLSITVVGEAPQNIEALKKRYSTWRCNTETPCFIKQMKLNNEDDKQTLVFYFQSRSNKYKLHTDHYTYDKKWRKGISYTSKNIEKERLPEIIQSIQHKQAKLIQPKYLDFEIEGIRMTR